MARGGGDGGGGASPLLRVRAAVVLSAAVAVLSVVTGIANIGSTTVSGPVAPYVPPDLRGVVGFTGALTGFLMLTSVAGLRRGFRIAWVSTLVLLPVTALQGLAQSRALTVPGFEVAVPVSLPLLVLSVLALPALLLNWRVFDRELELTTTQLSALAAIVGAQVYGTVGTWVLRDEFLRVETVTDAFYYTLVTASTVGYGDVTPTTEGATLFAMSVLLLGTASFAVALGTLLTPAIEARLANALGTMSQSQLDLFDDHFIVVGVGDLTGPILEELEEGKAKFIVISRDAENSQRLRERGYEVITADPSEDDPLRRAGIDRARALVAATNDDAQDAMVILTARELNPALRIVAAATDRENVKKLRRAGADTVLSPSVIGGHLLVQSAFGQAGMEDVADRILSVDDDDDVAQVTEQAPATEAEDGGSSGSGDDGPGAPGPGAPDTDEADEPEGTERPT
jgi:voltage-gated potassium channel